MEGENFYNAYKDLIENREDWINKDELIKFLQYETNPNKYKKYIKEIKQLENSYYIFKEHQKLTNDLIRLEFTTI